MQSTKENCSIAKQQFYPLDFDHRNDKKLKTIKDQVKFLIDEITLILKSGCGKVAILYSANNKQALDLYTHYRYKDKIDGDIDGHGQAVLFKELIKVLYEKNLDHRVIILPIATTMVGGEYNPVSESEIIRDLTNVISQLDLGYHVIALQNPKKTVQKRGQRYLIGGGVADLFYTNQRQRLYYHEMPLTQGQYVERTLDFLSVAYGGGVTVEEQEKMLQELKNILSPYQSMALTPRDDVLFSFLIPRPLSLVHYISRGLVMRYILPSSMLGLVNAAFDNGLNLFVSCDNEALCNRINDGLAQYRAKVVSYSSKEHSPFVFRINAEHAVDFLLRYCKISVEFLSYFYAHQLSRLLNKNVIIIPNGILYQSQKYNVEQFARIVADNELTWLALSSLENICTPLSSNSLKRTYRYNPIINSNDDEICRSFLSVARDLKRVDNEKDSKISGQINTIIYGHYDLMTSKACQFLKDISTDDIVKMNGRKLEGIGNYYNFIVKLIDDDIFSINYKSQENIERGAFKFWLYVQISHLAFQRGNLFVAFMLMNALKGSYDIFSPILDPQTKDIFNQLNMALCASQQLDHLRKVMGESTYFQHHYGVSIPPIVFYLMWMNNGIETGQTVERAFIINERLSPILSELSTLTLFHKDVEFYEPKGSDRVEFVRLLEKYSKAQLIELCSNLERYSVCSTIEECVIEISALVSLPVVRQSSGKIRDITQRYDVFSGRVNVFTDLLGTGRVDLLETALKHCLFRSSLLKKGAIDFVIDSQKDPILKFKLIECIKQFLSTERNMQVTSLVRKPKTNTSSENLSKQLKKVDERESNLIFDVNSFIPADPLLCLITRRISQSTTPKTSSVLLLTKADIVEYVKSDISLNLETRMRQLLQEYIPNLQAGSTILVPINIDNMHFTTFAIRRNQNGMLSALYIDTFGDFGQTASVILQMCNLIGNIKLSTYCVNYQFNNDCAVHVELNCAIILQLRDEQFDAHFFEIAMKNFHLDDPTVMTRKRLQFAKRVINLPEISNYFQEIAITERLANCSGQNRNNQEHDIQSCCESDEEDKKISL